MSVLWIFLDIGTWSSYLATLMIFNMIMYFIASNDFLNQAEKYASDDQYKRFLRFFFLTRSYDFSKTENSPELKLLLRDYKIVVATCAICLLLSLISAVFIGLRGEILT